MTSRAELAELQRRFLSFRLERALSRLRSPIYFLNTGAHPDDEHSGLLAWLRFGRGISTATLSSTRGQGGQNRIGSERGDLLGLIRSREMEHAAEVLDCDHIWLDRGPGDPLTDFGFSKSGEDTLRRWGGEASVLDRMVRVYRRYRPDIVQPTFLDVPGQHGHHRAMTKVALAAAKLAADPSYLTEGLTPWRVAKTYLPAWSGGGATYDDELPPPAVTLPLAASSREPLTGATWTQIGEASRLCHATQDMGDPLRAGPDEWPLHLIGGGGETDILDGLPQTYIELAGAPEAFAGLDALLADAVHERGSGLVSALVEADELLAAGLDAASEDFLSANGHRLERLRSALHRAVLLAAGDLPDKLIADRANFAVGDVVSVSPNAASNPANLKLTAPAGFGCEAGQITARAEAQSPAPFSEFWQSLGGNGPFFGTVSSEISGRSFSASVDFAEIPNFIPEQVLEWIPSPLIHRRTPSAQWHLDLPENVTLDLPTGIELAGDTLVVSETLAEGHHRIPVLYRGGPASVARIGRLANGETVTLFEPLAIDLLSLDLSLPEGKIGYLPGTENLTPYLKAAGFDVVALDALPDDLAQFDTILLGAIAFGTHPPLVSRLADLCAWVRNGGNLVTLYQRPDQGWPKHGIGLDTLQIGVPSVRWRVTDPEAPVQIIASAPLLASPNAISAKDFDGWDKDRGLYFASRWGDGYQPLLASADQGEQLLFGSLLSGEFGRGRHSHVALSLHHQIERFVPGAYRLLANLLQPTRQD